MKTKNDLNKTVFGTHEWAIANANFINGCAHDCKYCYSKEMAIRFKRKTKNTWKNEVIRSSYDKIFKKIDGRIMFPSSHDIHPKHLNYSINFLERILIPGNDVLIVTKPHFECIKSICDKFIDYRENILFRFTIGSSDDEVLKFWEEGAPCFNERLAALEYAYERGYSTSVSCEPMLDNNISEVVEKTLPYITDSIWIGKANYLIKRIKQNGVTGKKDLKRANQLLEWQSDENIFELFHQYKNNNKIKWKESIKSIVGIEIPTAKGLDI